MKDRNGMTIEIGMNVEWMENTCVAVKRFHKSAWLSALIPVFIKGAGTIHVQPYLCEIIDLSNHY